jgi:osmotically-inducible protein OsmY
MNSDLKLRDDVLDELCFEPSIDENHIGVITNNGVVTLTGHVSSFAQKRVVEKAVKRVAGVKAIAEEIEVTFPFSMEKTDAQVAEAAANAIDWNSSIPDGKVNVKVEEGWVYLDGEVNWQYQKSSAKNAVSQLWGVKNVVNQITLKSPVKPMEVKASITKALERAARIDADHISVEAIGHEVILKGTVHSWDELKNARKAAQRAQGVWTVKNELKVV